MARQNPKNLQFVEFEKGASVSNPAGDKVRLVVLAGGGLAVRDGSTTSAILSEGGTVVATAGAFATPGISFSGDATTGFYSPGAGVIGFAIGGGQYGGITSSGMTIGAITLDVTNQDVKLIRDTGGGLALRNSTNAQKVHVYNTYTDASNYERSFLRWSSNTLEIGNEAVGSGSVRDLTFKLAAVSALTLQYNAGSPKVVLPAGAAGGLTVTAGGITLSAGALTFSDGTSMSTSRRTVSTVLTSTVTLDDTYDLVRCNSSSGTFTVTLPTAVGRSGKRYDIKKVDATTTPLTIATTSSQTIDGASTLTLSVGYQSRTLVSDGANWMVI